MPAEVDGLLEQFEVGGDRYTDSRGVQFFGELFGESGMGGDACDVCDQVFGGEFAATDCRESSEEAFGDVGSAAGVQHR
ncbi:hypothetical protein CQY20_00005 [Mycolicibacterium agri]|uniref:Uncharacterized protein n=1 Tax=Mycolicibacterium agri TaxID=36811 RepID=A0A2A7NGP6_MYCAG|nr:hypothetical protein [Mycolicibacterium agri]PEG43030.1 hypothetical protein CQY20_00005 [Mycolicibacterium agri]